jgi:hypothetical protein
MSDDPSTFRNFSQLLSAAEDGRLNSDLSQALREALSQLEEVSGGRVKAKATFNLTLTLTLDGGGLVEVGSDYKVKLPKMPRARTLLYATPEGNLTRRNPRQPDLPLRDVQVPRASGLA